MIYSDFYKAPDDINKQIVQKLFSIREERYKSFQCKLLPTIDCDRIIGVRIPLIRALAKELFKDGAVSVFLHTLPHYYYDENNLHAFLIEQIKDYDECISELNRFLPHLDNWATCDSMNPRCFKNYTDVLIADIDVWLASSETYTVRFGMKTLMTHYLDKNFDESFPKKIAEIRSDEYYVKMMAAWYFATALAKQWDSVVQYIEQRKLPVWIHNKTIQKAIESYRISNEKKQYLRSMKITTV